MWNIMSKKILGMKTDLFHSDTVEMSLMWSPNELFQFYQDGRFKWLSWIKSHLCLMMLYFPGVKYIGKYFRIYMCETEKLIFKNKTDIFCFCDSIPYLKYLKTKQAKLKHIYTLKKFALVLSLHVLHHCISAFCWNKY